MGAASAAGVVIGGRVLDASAVLAFVEQRSVYASAVWTATEEDIVLMVPAAVLAEVQGATWCSKVIPVTVDP